MNNEARATPPGTPTPGRFRVIGQPERIGYPVQA